MQSSPNREPIRPQPRHQRNSKRFGNFSPQRVSVEHKSPGLLEGGLGSSRAVADRHGQRVLLRSIAATDLELCRPGPFWNSAAWEKIGRAMSKARKLKLRRLAWAAWDREHMEAFATWMCCQGGEYEYGEALSTQGLEPVILGYHGEENEEFPEGDPRRKGEFLNDDTIHVARVAQG